jgi:hypothetical protein
LVRQYGLGVPNAVRRTFCGKGSGNGTTRGDRKRNARRELLRGLLPREGAVIGHDVRVLARKTVRAKAFRLGEVLDWAAGQARRQGTSGSPRPAGGVLGRGGFRAGPAGEEEVPGVDAEVPYCRQQRRGGCSRTGRRLFCGQSLGEVGAQRLVPAVRRGARAQEEFPAGPGRLRGIR